MTATQMIAVSALPRWLFLCVLLLSCCSGFFGRYQEGDSVTLWRSNVGPYDHLQHPQGSVNYSSLFCPPHGVPAHKAGGLNEIYNNEALVDSQIGIQFMMGIEGATMCVIELDPAKAQEFKDAVDNNYWFQYNMDDKNYKTNSPIKLRAFMGKKEVDGTRLIWTHMKITIYYENSEIVGAELSQENPVPLEEGALLNMTYSVMWTLRPPNGP